MVLGSKLCGCKFQTMRPATWAYRCRHLVENLWARLKEWRAVATRYEKTATSFLAVIHIAAAADWIKR
ncbi:transposase [Acetobacter senegalensis]|nr:transposase [Acetobacter senegalensis]MDN7351745.1 transposase [Acetobacter senegalensis]